MLEKKLQEIFDNLPPKESVKWPVFLYIKTHKSTGLKYFGKTSSDPFSYQGSGVYWKQHLKKHGKECSTEIYGEYEDFESLVKDAITFSIENDIVSSDNWANLTLEHGLDGFTSWQTFSQETREKISKNISESLKGNRLSEETKRKISLAKSGRMTGEDNHFFGKTHTPEARKAISIGAKKAMMGRKKTPEHAANISKALKGRNLSEEHRKKVAEANRRRAKAMRERRVR